MPSGCVFPFEQRLRGALPTQLVQTGHVTSRHVVYAVYSGCNAVQFFFPSGWKKMSGKKASGPNSPSANMFTYHFLSTYFFVFVLFFAVHLRHIFSPTIVGLSKLPLCQPGLFVHTAQHHFRHGPMGGVLFAQPGRCPCDLRVLHEMRDLRGCLTVASH